MSSAVREHLGAGRRTKEDPIDHAVGVVCRRKRGDAVAVGEPLAEIHARDEDAAGNTAELVRDAYTIGDDAPRRVPIVLDVLGAEPGT